MAKTYTNEQIKKLIREKINRTLGKEPWQVTDKEMYRIVCLVVRDMLASKWVQSRERVHRDNDKQVYYLSMEFLPGTLLHNNIYNLKVEDQFKSVLEEMNFDLETLYGIDPDAGLGNGGLGRLASCYLDALTTQGMSAHGMSICYEYGIFKQKIVDNCQTEEADDWQELGDCWLITKNSEAERVEINGSTILAIPRDLLISGYNSSVVNSLRLWQATSEEDIDMELFAKGEYLKSMEKKHKAEIISKILYPEDAHDEGKTLRISQQYFFISASLQSLVKKHLRQYDSLDNFSEKIALHINDTHPTMAIPELMRILVDDYGYEWEDAWDIVTKTVSYTNHTILPEALEKWPERLFKKIIPRIHEIILEINRRFSEEIREFYPGEDGIKKSMAIVEDEQIRMANLCVAASHRVNGVSTLHSEIVRRDLFGYFSKMTPQKFDSVTNGIAYRRWLCQANPKLSSLLEELLGSKFKTEAFALEKLLVYREDKPVLEQLDKIKTHNKLRLAQYIKEHNGIIVDPNSIFDVQVKRLHEYKRQLLNLIHIMHLYEQIKDDPNIDITPHTFIFGAKAAGGYHIAKEIIKLACNLSAVLEKDLEVRDRLKIVFLENYSVSLSELIMPAADISEQISLAGKEASGTGNMKLMINGAVTLGTEDGANVEIHQAVGDENIFIFGMNVEEVHKLRESGTYSPWQYINENPEMAMIMDDLTQGINGETFNDIAGSLTTGINGIPDEYFVLADFEDYKRAQQDITAAYLQKKSWNQKSLVNIAKAGVFSADRAVLEYADRMWDLKKI